MKRALICGVSGQDGAYLAKLLLNKGYQVFGSSRDAQVCSFRNLHLLGIRDQVKTVSMTLNDFRSVFQVLQSLSVDEIYNLSGQSSVGLSFEQPHETLASIALGTLNLLEAIRFLSPGVRLYNAGSSECFGDNGKVPACEETPLRPRSPYAISKSAAHWLLANYREAYGILACTGFLFNHESCLRPERFVTQKIIASAKRIAAGKKERLVLGNMKIVRDWGWSPEYVEAMWKMLQLDSLEDFVIATGKSVSLEQFVNLAFSELGLDWREHVDLDESFYRLTELKESHANPRKAFEKLKWQAKFQVEDVVRNMLEGRMED